MADLPILRNIRIRILWWRVVEVPHQRLQLHRLFLLQLNSYSYTYLSAGGRTLGTHLHCGVSDQD